MSEDATSNLRNEDFRKLLEGTPQRSGGTGETPARSSTGTVHSFSHRHQPKPEKKKGGHGHKQKREKTEEEADGDNLKEILKNYRDRALERRQKGTDDPDESAKLAAAYRAVPGDARAATDKANLRKQAIEESKYLGGDMEHTHLVKGLDFSLLHKVRSEIVKSQNDDAGDDLEKAYNQAGSATATAPAAELVPETENRMVKAVHRLLFVNELPVRNELFGKGRMAYVVDMEEEDADIPTTLLRSLQDCPKAESNANINANNMLISKLTQVLAYLRTDTKKKKRHDMTEEDQKKYQSQSIFDNETDYVPRRERDRERDRKDDRDRDRRKDRHYFDDGNDRDRRHKDRDRGDDRDRRGGDRDRHGRDDKRDREREREKERERERKERDDRDKEKRLEEKMEKRRKEAEGGGYDECYPGGMVEMEGGWDSDEEADFSKMDQGNKKPPVKRWDFEHQEDYEKYQGGREAMPKAAYQFGLKPADGRKTRKSIDTNKKIDRELNQINQIIEKRKGGKDDDGGDYKRPKY